MPVLSTTMEEGTVAEWLKREGDTVARDEPLLMVEMDKGTLEVPAPASGVLRRIVVQPGTTVAVRTLIAEIGEPGEVVDGPSAAPSAAVCAAAALTSAICAASNWSPAAGRKPTSNGCHTVTTSASPPASSSAPASPIACLASSLPS